MAAWQRGWVLLDSLVGTDVIDAAVEELWRIFPRPESHADPTGRPRSGSVDRRHRDEFLWPEGLGFRPSSTVAGRVLSRAAPQSLVHGAGGRRLHDPRHGRPTCLYQAQCTAVLGHDELRATQHGSEPLVAAASDGTTVVARRIVPLPSDVDAGRRRTRGARRLDRPVPDRPLIWPPNDPDIYRRNGRRRSNGSPRYRPDVSTAVERPRDGRSPLNISHKIGQDWIAST